MAHLRGTHKFETAECCAPGAISETEVVVQFLALLAGGLGVSYILDKCAALPAAAAALV